MKDEAFVYIWRDSNSSKFYLGYHKGSTDDNYAHSSTAMESFTMWSIPDGYKRRILATGTNEEMIELETKLLTNRNERGQWWKYHNISTNTFPILRDDPEYYEMQSERTKEQWTDPEFCKMMSEKTKEQWTDPEFRKKMSEKNKERWADPEFRKKVSDGVKSKWKDPEFRKMKCESMSVQSKELWKDPEFRKNNYKRMSKQSKKLWADPEFRKKVSEKHKERWADPEFRKNNCERISKQSKKLWDDPEFRKKMRGTCSVCGFESSRSAIVQYHNDKCKVEPTRRIS
jgi:hypothetical protein